jgi:hypothetical protein
MPTESSINARSSQAGRQYERYTSTGSSVSKCPRRQGRRAR